MTTKRLSFFVLAAAAAVCAGGLALAAPGVVSQPIPESLLGPRINLECKMQTSDIVRVHTIKNTTVYPIPAGISIHWANPYGDHGTINLQQALAPGATTYVQKPGITPGGNCTAYFHAGHPDLVVEDLGFVTLNGVKRIRVVIRNLNNFAPAGVSKASIEGYKCPQTVTQTRQFDVPAIAAGGAATHFEVAQPATIWLRAIANVTNSVKESNPNNNFKVAFNGSCIY